MKTKSPFTVPFEFARRGTSLVAKLIGTLIFASALSFTLTARGQSDFKWNQPPEPAHLTNIFNGWNQPSVDGIFNLNFQAADDWVCTTTNPVTKVRWWGSFTNWQSTNLPPGTLSGFWIAFYGDVPAGPGSPSHPQIQPLSPLHFYPFPNPYFTWHYVGRDYDPRSGQFESCFLFEQTLQDLTTNYWFYQTNGPSGTNIYWVSIMATGQQDANFYWGWKTRPRNPSSPAPDAAVSFNWQGNPNWQPIWWPGPMNGWDLAFELISQPTAQVKWSQLPVPFEATNVFNGWNEYSVLVPPPPFIDADDWVCTTTNPVTDLHWWGSFIGWSETNLPLQIPDGFFIQIFTDVPAGVDLPFSHPGTVVWSTTCSNFTWSVAGWDEDPRSPGAPWETCFKFEQNLSTNEWFYQTNGATGTNIYWLSIAALYFNNPPDYPWGWKTRPRDTNSLAPDGAVIYDINLEPPNWRPISWPTTNDLWDLAFALTTQETGGTEELDFGDAPDPAYPTLLASDGARHVIVPGVKLGANLDAEANGQPNATATGDDLAGVDDEDGVGAPWGMGLIPGEIATVTVSASVSGFLSAWVDFNVDGSWATAGDQIFTNVPVVAGANNPSFNVPFTAARGTNTFARFRFSTQTITNFTGWAPDGEVEDYQWHLEELDFGDAPDPTFPTIFASNGARHIVIPTIYLGAAIDSEIDGQPNATATGDDNANLPDEDGVTLLTPLQPGQLATVQVVATMLGGLQLAPLNAWIDFGADGSWATPGDQIFTNAVLTPGINILSFNVPPGAAVGSNLFARFRFSTMPGLTPTGLAPNGEVEDYRWNIEELDYGDAPVPYPTLLASNGARHVRISGFCLGTLEDLESDGLPQAQANGDDLTDLADEDGVTWPAVLLVGTQACVNVVLTAGQNGGRLDAWVDFNGNGSWETSAGEQVFTNRYLVPGTNANLCFQVPANAILGTNFARFRLSSAGNLPPTGLALDGEVEDYLVRTMQHGPATNIVITNVVATATNVTIDWSAEANVHYLLQTTTNLRPVVVWTNVGSEVIGPAHAQTETNLAPRQQYFRVVAPQVWP